MNQAQKELLEKTNQELRKVSGDCRLSLAVLSYAINKYLELESK